MEKVERDGMIAVVYSPEYGAGWFTMNDNPKMLFAPEIVEMVEAGRQEEIDEDWTMQKLSIGACCGGAKDLKIEWVPMGTAFKIESFDGRETITYLGSDILVA